MKLILRHLYKMNRFIVIFAENGKTVFMETILKFKPYQNCTIDPLKSSFLKMVPSQSIYSNQITKQVIYLFD
jgi:hypothetical protein